MATSERFNRWQSVVREQLSSASNTVLGLSTGITAFIATHLVGKNHLSSCIKCLYVGACILLFFSIVAAVICAITRLNDYRVTLRIVRLKKEKNKEVEELRKKAAILGGCTWGLFYAQMLLFLLGSFFAVIAIILEV